MLCQPSPLRVARPRGCERGVESPCPGPPYGRFAPCSRWERIARGSEGRNQTTSGDVRTHVQKHTGHRTICAAQFFLIILPIVTHQNSARIQISTCRIVACSGGSRVHARVVLRSEISHAGHWGALRERRNGAIPPPPPSRFHFPSFRTFQPLQRIAWPGLACFTCRRCLHMGASCTLLHSQRAACPPRGKYTIFEKPFPHCRRYSRTRSRIGGNS